jgi:hypothetical protein
MKLNFYKIKKISYQWVFFLSCLSCYLQQGTVVKLSPKKDTTEKKSLGTADLHNSNLLILKFFEIFLKMNIICNRFMFVSYVCCCIYIVKKSIFIE